MRAGGSGPKRDTHRGKPRNFQIRRRYTMKKFAIGILIGLILGAVTAGTTLMYNAQVRGTDNGYTITVFGQDFEYR
jgi:hypothetical protein